jgi:hypothetical protein
MNPLSVPHFPLINHLPRRTRMKCWITTHWPSPKGFEVARHVYFKSNPASLPRPGDLVLIYEAQSATVNSKAVKRAEMQYHGKREWVQLPKGRGRIVAAVTVKETARRITGDDRVYDYGNLSEWSLIPCGDEKAVTDIPRSVIMELLDKPPTTPPRFWSLWKVPDKYMSVLLSKLGLQT